jgi:AcrR family transcriptional regulator
VNQKARTRAAIVEAATAILRRGTPPTVAAAADEARVSRATAYRYFPTQDALLVEVVAVSPAVAPVEEALGRPAETDPEARLVGLLDALNGAVLDAEVSMRQALRVYLDTWLESRGAGRDTPPVREGRRVRWLDEALEPVRRELPEAEWVRLRAALSLTMGADAVVVMKDVCRLEDDEALEVLRWAATALLRAGLADARPRTRRRTPAATA